MCITYFKMQLFQGQQFLIVEHFGGKTSMGGTCMLCILETQNKLMSVFTTRVQ